VTISKFGLMGINWASWSYWIFSWTKGGYGTFINPS